MGDGGRIDPQFFILFSELGVDPILFCFSRLIFVTGLILKVIVFLGISFGWWKKPAKLGNEIKTKNLS